MSEIKLTLTAEEREAISVIRDAARAFRETGGAVDDTSARLKAYHAELSGTTAALSGLSGDVKGIRTDLAQLNENILKLHEGTKKAREGQDEMAAATKKARQEAAAQAAAVKLQAEQEAAQTAARLAAVKQQIEATTGIDRARAREKERNDEVSSSVRALSEDERALLKWRELQEGATGKSVRVGMQYYQVTHDQVEAMKLLAQTHRSSQLAHQKTAEDLERLRRAYTAGLMPIHEYTEAEARLTTKLADQTRRWEANRGRSLSMLKDEMENVIRSMVPFGNTIINMTSHFTNMNTAAAGASAVFPSVTGALAAMVNPATLAIIAVGALSAGLVLAGSKAAPFVHDMRDLENTLGLVGKQTSEARAQMAALQEKAMGAATLGIGPREAAAAMGQLASLGLNATDTLKAFEPVALLAKARGLDMATAAKIAGADMAIFGTNVNDLGKELDKLSIISNLTGIQASDLQTLMAKAGKGAVAAGQDFNSIAIAAGLARNAGVDMDVAMTGLGTGLLHVASQGRAAFTALTGGQDIVDKTTGKFRPLEQILIEVIKATAGMTDADRAARVEKIFGREALTALLPVMAQMVNGIKDEAGNLLKGADAAKYMREQLDNAGGANKRFAENLADSLQGQQERFHALVDAVTTGIGTKIEPALKSLYAVANVVLEAMNSIFAPGETRDPMRQRFDALLAQVDKLGKRYEAIMALPYGERSHNAGEIEAYENAVAELRKMRAEMAGANADKKKTAALTAEQAALAADLTKKEAEELRRLQKDVDSLNAASLTGVRKLEAERKAALADIQRDIEKAREAGIKSAEVYDAFKSKQAATNRKYSAEIAKAGEEAGKKWADQQAKIREETGKLIREGLDPLQKAEFDQQQQTERAWAQYQAGLYGRVNSTEALIALQARLDAVERAYTKTVEDEAGKREEAIRKEAEVREKETLQAIGKAIEADRKASESRKKLQASMDDAQRAAGSDRATAEQAINERMLDASAKVLAAYQRNLEIQAADRQTIGEQELASDSSIDEQRKADWQDLQDTLTAIQDRASRDRLRISLNEADQWLGVSNQFAGAFQKINGAMLNRYQSQYQKTTKAIESDEQELADLKKKVADGTATFQERRQVEMLEARLAAERDTQEKQKAQAVKMFKWQQALSIATAAISGAQAAMKAIEQWGPPPSPMGIAGIAAAALITGAEIAVIATQEPPQMHVGGMVTDDDRATSVIQMPRSRLQPDEVLVNKLVGEGEVNRRGMRQIGEDGLSRLNRLGELPSSNVTIQLMLGHKQLDQVIYRSTRSSGGPIMNAVRSMTGARPGHRSRG